METAKVDIRKLQLLNDRINQCIDALNQVRVSVHGLSHASAAGAGIPFGQAPLGQTPYGMGFGAGYAPAFAQPLGYQPFVAQQVPMGQGYNLAGYNPAIGLSHSSPESLETRAAWADPLVAARIAQTFPYLYYPVSPAVGAI
ncbi:MAG TPA: hypothetical protein VMN04_08200 [Thermoanaerobaculia bacterium]|nr:hypothetical protein [Thermoanaerobaculia bacterium]